MLITEKTEKEKETYKTSTRRSHLNLSLEERRRQLVEQANKLASHYENTKKERETWQGSDLVEL